MQNTQKDVYKKVLGKSGEKSAEKYLISLGYKLLERNYKTKLGEIDLIFLSGKTTVFVEVKTRSNDAFGGAEAVGRLKQKKYSLVANEYLVKNGKTDSECRFDVVEIIDGKINHIIDAFSL